MQYNITIGRLRGLCALAVVLYHYAIYFPSLKPIFGIAAVNGYYGVTAFFAVSGYLITSLLLARYGELANVSLREFYIMRIARILPPLLLVLAVLSVLFFLNAPGFEFKRPSTWPDAVLSALTFNYNLYRYGPRPWHVLWSLSVEEVFYIGYPILALITRRTWILVIALVGLVIFGPIYRSHVNHIGVVYFYFACFDAIAMGALAALGARSLKGRVSPVVLATLSQVGWCLMLLVHFTLDMHYHFVLGPSLIALGAALVLFCSGVPLSPPQQAQDPLAVAGRFSYEIYLFHMIVFALLAPWLYPALAGSKLLLFTLVMSIVIGVSALIGLYFSEPLNRRIREVLLRRLQKPPRATTEPAAAAPATT